MGIFRPSEMAIVSGESFLDKMDTCPIFTYPQRSMFLPICSSCCTEVVVKILGILELIALDIYFVHLHNGFFFAACL